MTVGSAVLFDNLNKKLDTSMDEIRNSGASESPDHVAVMLALTASLQVTTDLVEACERVSKTVELPEDIVLLNRRVRMALKFMDPERIRNDDKDYIRTSFKDCIDSMATPTEDEIVYHDYEEVNPLWNLTMVMFRQIQAFYEAKVTFEVADLDNNR